MKSVPCPNCGEPANAGAANTCRPFCSRRCKLIDLGDWLTEEHRIPGNPAEGAWNPAESEDDDSGQSRH